ncbi:nucleotidyl transferase AbiEii/AbiGii toxin family protein [Enterococcus faecalis]|uniref:nucleotidyl transferase AbiEii/AbiGii toxin family protein n=1 Tax=Enterococcus faecalis TaxID=1351 RepID=UPI003CC61119
MFYDIHVLIKSQEFNKEILNKALIKTAKQRGSLPLLDNTDKIISSIEKDVNMKKQWNTYKSNYPYAMEYSWDSLIISVSMAE